MKKKTIRDISVAGKKVLLRVDFNVPLDSKGNVTDDSRIKACLPTIRYLTDNGARLIICSHLDRPEGKLVEGLRLTPVVHRLAELLGRPVWSIPESIGPDVETAVARLKQGDILLLENIRFHPEEEVNDPDFASALARLADVFVNDAFGASHRSHASVVGVTKYLPAVAGFLMEKEIEALSGALENPKRPFAAILGGAKVGGKIAVLENIVDKVDTLLIGGGMAATFFKSMGFNIGKSKVENDKLDYVRQLRKKMESRGVKLLLPLDLVVATKLEVGADTRTVPVVELSDGFIIGDVGPETIEEFSRELSTCGTIIWNGPLGVFEIPEFASGTRSLIEVLAKLKAVTVIGGGSTAEAVVEAGLVNSMSHVSTGGGASLEFLEGKMLPGVAALQDK